MLLLVMVVGQLHGSLIQESIDRELLNPWDIRSGIAHHKVLRGQDMYIESFSINILIL